MKYIALLRGINVSGHKLIKMELLRKALEKLPFANVSTYIQSGNIIFESALKDVHKLENLIHETIQEHFGFDVPVIVVTPKELQSVLDSNPFPGRYPDDSVQPYVAFLSEIPLDTNISVLKQLDFAKDEFRTAGKTMYLSYADSAANTKLSNAVIENKLKVKATTRNWKTIKKLLELASK